ncbi:DUF2525 domain-containing protein [Klebsiella aerogenes]|uniref:DUF2525 domain-containing protein n=1 Tax=Klebsiella aerogenes TaxID=548 RepID=UPI0007E8BF26|nr:DUF2525 domain-containing protein [Klebsiella aerogenes]
MKSAKDHGVMNTDGIDVNVDALLAAINEISESEVHRSEDDPHHVSIDGRDEHTWRELVKKIPTRRSREQTC